MKLALASMLTCVALTTSVSMAQTPPRTPTQEECDKGFNENAGLTREQFVKACAEMKAKKP